MMERSKIQAWSKVALIAGGVLILVGTLVGALVMSGAVHAASAGFVHAYFGDTTAMMAFWMVVTGLIAGRLVLLSAFHVHTKRQVAPWGAAAIVVGILSLVAVGGFVIGALAAVAGGTLALVAAHAAPAA